MYQYILGILLMIGAVIQFSVAENICLDLDRQEVIAPPKVFPVFDINMRCGWDRDDFSVQYTTSRKNGRIEDYDYRLANIIALENSKSWDDALFDGDFEDPNYIDNQPFVALEKKESDTFVIALEVKYLNQTEILLTVLNPLSSYITLSCIDKTLQHAGDRADYRNVILKPDIKEILLSDQCQKAIERFNIPLTLEEIEGIKPAEGSLN